MASSLLGCQVLPCGKATNCWLVGLNQQTADCGILVSLGLVLGPVSSVQFSCSVVSNSLRPHGLQHASARLLVVKVRVQDTQGCFHILVDETSPGVTASILAVRTRSWSLVAECMGHRAGVKSLVWWGWFMKQLESVLKLMFVCWFMGPEPSGSQSRFWLAHEQVQSTD